VLTPVPAPSSQPLVLYVDDERANRVVFEQSLASEFNIKVASDPETALQMMSKLEVAVVVTDMRMPTMNGEQLLRIVKERYPQVIRMVVTAYADVDPILRAINEGLVARYIIKPWVRTELVQVLRWAIEAWTFSKDSSALHHRLLETERLASLGSIAAMLVHDLKQPLVGLIVNAENLVEFAASAPTIRRALQTADIDEVEKARLIDGIDDLLPLANDLKVSTQHLNQLISGLRDFTRPRKATAPASTDPLPIVRHAMSVCQELAVPAHASIGYSGPGHLPAVRISATELTQVLINLVANATQAVAARGVPNGHVSIVATSGDAAVELQVRDDGVGMAPDVLSRVGTPFFTTRADGTGLGLAQCQRLIGTAGGRFRIESQAGVGTTVTIILPTVAA
jgi:signal transduction histidine kinase